MKPLLILGGAAVAALLGGAALAQPAPATDLQRAPIPPTHDYSQPATTAQPGSGYSAPPVGAVVGSTTTTTSATTSGTDASVTTQMVSNGPVPDTAENRKKFGGPMSRAGRHTRPAGN